MSDLVNIAIYKGGTLSSVEESVSDYRVQSGYLLLAGTGGTATGTLIFRGATMAVLGGTVVDSTVYDDAILLAETDTSDITVLSGGTFAVTGGVATELFAASNATVAVTGGMLDKAAFYGGTATVENGILSASRLVQNCSVTIGSGGSAYSIIQNGASTAMTVLEGGILFGLESLGSTTVVNAGGSVADVTLESYTQEDDPTVYAATLSLKCGASLSGRINIDSESSLLADSGSIIEFTLAATTAGASSPLLNDFSRISGTPEFTLSVSETQDAGAYALAGNAAGFAADLSLVCGEYASKELEVGGDAVTYHNGVYSLSLNEGTLGVAVSEYQTLATADALNWAEINGAENYTLEISCGTATLATLDVAAQGVELFGLADGDYAWRVRNSAEIDNWQSGASFTQSAAATEPQEYVAADNGAEDIFFANAEGVWGAEYAAFNANSGTSVNLAGYARVTDVFAGSADASTLILCGGTAAEKGVALFVDDVYSAAPASAQEVISCAPDAKASGRLSQIDTIIATSADDLIDLTSTWFSFGDGVTVEGGSGNDVIWCNSGDDLIIGGAGDDVMHGGGGADTFRFSGDWGNDTVGQTADGTITLWVEGGDESHWDAVERIYTDGINTIIVEGTAAVTMRY